LIGIFHGVLRNKSSDPLIEPWKFRGQKRKTNIELIELIECLESESIFSGIECLCQNVLNSKNGGHEGVGQTSPKRLQKEEDCPIDHDQTIGVPC
jgi:hypothetical protein